jgi:hypothetical protein
MRKLILVAALVLVSATAEAGGKRSPTLASSSDAPAKVEPSKAGQSKVEQSNAAEAMKSVERPRLSMRQPSSRRSQRPYPVATRNTSSFNVGMLKRRGATTLARIKYALHRHGFYW